MTDTNIKIEFPEITQEDFDHAFECLEVCKRKSAEKYGFNYPYFTPGGLYGEQWWQLDSALALCGYKWYDRSFAETSLLNFIEAQKADGRICLWGYDTLPGGNYKQIHGVSSLPKIFDVAYHILQGTTDKILIENTHEMMKKYLEWWFKNRQDKKTGLITATFEETFIPYLGCAGEYAPVDTNVEVAVGCRYTADIAVSLGKSEEAEYFNAKQEEIAASVNKYLWSEEKGAYYPFSIKDNRLIDCLMASAFCPLRLGMLSQERKARLIELLTDHKHFNWQTIPLTSVSKCDPIFKTTRGEYKGNDSWSGNVWSLLNEMTVRGLLDCGENELAAELAVKTVYAFNHNCTEFVNPFDGSGHGVIQYAWTASQYIELIIEIIFGVCYNAEKNELSISPNIPKGLKNRRFSLKNLNIPGGGTLDLIIDNGEIEYSIKHSSVAVLIKNNG